MSHLNDVRPVVKEEYVQISITVGEERNFFCGLRFLVHVISGVQMWCVRVDFFYNNYR